MDKQSKSIIATSLILLGLAAIAFALNKIVFAVIGLAMSLIYYIVGKSGTKNKK